MEASLMVLIGIITLLILSTNNKKLSIILFLIQNIIATLLIMYILL